MSPKESPGDGFLCSAVLIFLVAFALLARPGFRGLLLSAILFPICGALAGDAFMNYFFASRQILFALPGLVILAAMGFLELYRRNKTCGHRCDGAVLLGAALQKDCDHANSIPERIGRPPHRRC